MIIYICKTRGASFSSASGVSQVFGDVEYLGLNEHRVSTIHADADAWPCKKEPFGSRNEQIAEKS